MSSTWEVVIGLEVHVQLATQSKIFSAASTAYGAAPNTQASAIDLGLPGVLPVVNAKAVELATRFGLAINAELGRRNIFDRKNYFYPDLPKGYQISQFSDPIVGKGYLDIEWLAADDSPQSKRINITRAHLEEDAGKSVHDLFDGLTAIDLNRAGTPLLEVVTEPELRSAREAVAYLKKLHALVRYLDVSDGNMQEGSFRCDANVSVRLAGQTILGTRTETKNLNSFRFVEQAINYEIQRQIEVIESGGEIVQETRLYDPDTQQTRTMRTKEEANDYRYFPDPDLLPVELTDEYIESIRQAMPELPDTRKARFISAYQLNSYDAGLLTTDKAVANYFEQVVEQSVAEPKIAANWVNGELAARLSKDEQMIEQSPVSAKALAELLDRIADNTVSNKIARQVFEQMWTTGDGADQIIEAQGLKQITDSGAIETIIDDIIAANPAQVEQYRAGKDKVFGFFVGQVMKAMQGKASPAEVNRLLKQKL